jgi:hypothetical protein
MASRPGPDSRQMKQRRRGLASGAGRCSTPSTDLHRMAETARRVFSEIDGVGGELVPGPFEDSDLQWSITLPNGLSVSVLPDVDVPALFEVVRTDRFMLLGDKLSSDRVLDLLRGAGVACAQELADG